MSGLTDEERELKRLAEKAAAKPFNGRESLYVHGLFESRATPEAVLRLLARIEELDRACGEAHKELFLGGETPESIARARDILSETVR